MTGNRTRLFAPQSSEPVARHRTSPIVVAAGLLAIFAGSWLGSQNIALRSALRESRPPRRDNNTVILQPGGTLPDVEVIDLTGDPEGPREPRPLHQKLRGSTVLFLFTSTCRFCARSFPVARTLQEQLDDLSVDLVGVAVDGRLPDAGGSGEPAVTYWAVAPIDLSAARKLGVEVVPTFLLVDPELSIVQMWEGELTESRLREIVVTARAVTTPGA